MTRDEAKALANEVGRRYGKRVAGLGPPLETFDVTLSLLCEEAVLEALARIAKPSRIEAAERAVVEHGMEWWAAIEKLPGSTGTSETLPAFLDAARRLRALREQAAAETCGAKPQIFVQVKQVHSESDVTAKDSRVYCHLPRGHEGEHEGELGTWRWK